MPLLFCNAGFMLTGFYADTPIGATKANVAVNVGCHLELVHEYGDLSCCFLPPAQCKHGATRWAVGVTKSVRLPGT